MVRKKDEPKMNARWTQARSRFPDSPWQYNRNAFVDESFMNFKWTIIIHESSHKYLCDQKNIMNHEWTRDERERVHDFSIPYGNTAEMRSSMNERWISYEWWMNHEKIRTLMNHEWTRDERKRVHDFPIPWDDNNRNAFIDEWMMNFKWTLIFHELSQK